MLNLECSLDDVEEKDDDDLLAMVSKTFTRFRTRNIVFQVVLLVLNPFKSTIICFQCGKKRQLMKECYCKSFTYTPLGEVLYKFKYDKINSCLILHYKILNHTLLKALNAPRSLRNDLPGL